MWTLLLWRVGGQYQPRVSICNIFINKSIFSVHSISLVKLGSREAISIVSEEMMSVSC